MIKKVDNPKFPIHYSTQIFCKKMGHTIKLLFFCFKKRDIPLKEGQLADMRTACGLSHIVLMHYRVIGHNYILAISHVATWFHL